LCLNGNDLIPDKLQDAVHYRLEALQNLLVRECHVAFLNASLWELSLDTDIDSPLLAIVSEVGLYPVLKVHDALGVDLACGFRTIRQFHLPNLGAQDVAKVTVQRRRTTRVTGSCCALGDGERLLFFNLVGDQIDGTTTTIDNQYSVVDLQVEQTSL
jgi:hypothetical protein